MLKFWIFFWSFGFAPLYFGGSGNSSSTSTPTTTNTTNLDKRLAMTSGIGVTADNSTIHVTSLDGGAVSSAFDFASKAQNQMSVSYDNLLKTSGSALTGIMSLANGAISTSQAALDTAQSKGTLDNRTITILGCAAALSAFAILRK